MTTFRQREGRGTDRGSAVVEDILHEGAGLLVEEVVGHVRQAQQQADRVQQDELPHGPLEVLDDPGRAEAAEAVARHGEVRHAVAARDDLHRLDHVAQALGLEVQAHGDVRHLHQHGLAVGRQHVHHEHVEVEARRDAVEEPLISWREKPKSVSTASPATCTVVRLM
jgi:hypothetical protein